MLDLNLLLTFEAIYRERHLGRAADALHVTPSAVSHALGRLRDGLGDPLFVKDGRRMRPSSVCRSIAPELLDALSRLRSVISSAGSFDAARSRRHFRIGIRASLEGILLPRLERMRSVDAPELRFTTQWIDRSEVGVDLAGGRSDAVVDVAQPVPPPISSQKLSEDPFVVVMRAENPLTGVLDLPAYLGARHIAVSTRGAGPVVEDFALSQLGYQRRIALRCQNYHAACLALLENDFLLTIPASIAQTVTRGLSTVQVDPPFTLAGVTLNLYWHRSNDDDAGNRWLRDQLIRAMTPVISP